MAQPFNFDSSGQYFLNTSNHKTLLYRLNLKYPILELKLSSKSKKTSFCFFNKDTIVSGNMDGDIEFSSICRNTTLKTIHLFGKEIQQIIHIPNTNYLLVHANTDAISIVDAKNYKIVHSRYREFKQAIHHIELSNVDMLRVTLKSAEMLDIELASTLKLRSLILHNSIKEAFELVKKDRMLEDSLEFKNLEEDYDISYKKAINALILGNTKLANSLIDRYKDIKCKEKSIKLLFKSFEIYERFKTFYKEKKYAICYAIVTQHTPLMLTKEYVAMQNSWEKLSTIAKVKVKNHDKKSAKAILANFITVNSKRDEIHHILSATNQKIEEDKLSILQNLYEKDDFFASYEYIDKYPELYYSELGIYLQKHYVKLIKRCEDYAIDGNIKEIVTCMGSLVELSKRKDRAGTILKNSFLIKIEKQLSLSNFNISQRLIYSYIDIFSIDARIKKLMKEYELLSLETLAISIAKNDDWAAYDFTNLD